MSTRKLSQKKGFHGQLPTVALPSRSLAFFPKNNREYPMVHQPNVSEQRNKYQNENLDEIHTKSDYVLQLRLQLVTVFVDPAHKPSRLFVAPQQMWASSWGLELGDLEEYKTLSDSYTLLSRRGRLFGFSRHPTLLVIEVCRRKNSFEKIVLFLHSPLTRRSPVKDALPEG